MRVVFIITALISLVFAMGGMNIIDARGGVGVAAANSMRPAANRQRQQHHMISSIRRGGNNARGGMWQTNATSIMLTKLC